MKKIKINGIKNKFRTFENFCSHYGVIRPNTDTNSSILEKGNTVHMKVVSDLLYSAPDHIWSVKCNDSTGLNIKVEKGFNPKGVDGYLFTEKPWSDKCASAHTLKTTPFNPTSR